MNVVNAVSSSDFFHAGDEYNPIIETTHTIYLPTHLTHIYVVLGPTAALLQLVWILRRVYKLCTGFL
jgi:hypothetical protein